MIRSDDVGLQSAASQNGSPDEFGATPSHDSRTNPGAVDPGGVIRQSALRRPMKVPVNARGNAAPGKSAPEATMIGASSPGAQTAMRSVKGSGYRVQGTGFRVQGTNFRVQGEGDRFRGAGFWVRRKRGGWAKEWRPPSCPERGVACFSSRSSRAPAGRGSSPMTVGGRG